MRANLFQAGEFTVTNKVLSAMASNALVQGASVKLHFPRALQHEGCRGSRCHQLHGLGSLQELAVDVRVCDCKHFRYRLMQASVNSLISQGIKTGKMATESSDRRCAGAAIGDSIKQAGLVARWMR